MYSVKLKKKVQKNLEKMPVSIQDTFFQLVDDLERLGPIQSEWPITASLARMNTIVIFQENGLHAGEMKKIQ